MTGSIDTQHDPAALGELERAVLEIVWARDGATADNVREQLGRPLKESTVRTVLARLEEKGYVSHEVSHRTFVYHSVQDRQSVAARAVKKIAEWFCSGSVEQLVVGMIESKALQPKDLHAISEHLKKARKGSAS